MPPEPAISYADIRARAYELWDRNHRPEGCEISFWLMAERELRSERTGQEPTAVESTDPVITGRKQSRG
ncbi:MULTISPECIES: DUF2934 domain-containing protein [Methylobacterium]|uniref:DUF2934 domain-containing protein n=1 Tax=Methylobacterium thuringiense TaxID=1003091 RepID=A0ABQ4TQ00_9HYPH|nr:MULTISPECIES: DUF2934 domain-containing protein [Methylobacterium]TXN21076.1 DUF2934 domain-containing protein [Methylobacterium sp. WL9]GJE56732.1 hypothetical protein EKPJFOCH_3240 [Methylobacterium thuringiense]